MPATPCPRCGNRETIPDAASFALLIDALADDDIDSAIDAGLLVWPGCIICNANAGLDPAAVAMLIAARDMRLAALAARERHLARQARLQRRAEAAAAKRSPSRETTIAKTGLPTAAAAALVRAKARAAGRDPK